MNEKEIIARARVTMNEKEIIARSRELMSGMTAEQVLDFVGDITADYCRYCGGYNPGICHCTNDE